MEINFWLSLSMKQRQTLCSRPLPVYQDLRTHHDWPIEKYHCQFASQAKGNLKCISGNSLIPSGTQNMDTGTASQTLLTGVRLRL